jgi:PLP dependent protein
MYDRNISHIKGIIAASGGSRRVTIVAVTKGRPVEAIANVAACGLTDFGENRIQEAREKIPTVNKQSTIPLRWHMIGHLQTNKAKDAVELFDTIESVDSIKLTSAIDAHAQRLGKVQDVLMQVNTSGESTKSGCAPQDLFDIIRGLSTFKAVKVRGLMTIAPQADDPEKSRVYFRLLRQLRDELNQKTLYPQPIEELSMGMSDDYRVAVEEGATIVRLGRAIYE